MTKPGSSRLAILSSIGIGAAIIMGLYLSSLYSYILFHSLVEIFTIGVACTLFILTWNTREYLANSYLRLLGIGYGFIALIDLVHTLAYKGMGVFPGYGSNLPTQLWIAARYLQAVVLFAAPFFVTRRVNDQAIIGIFALAAAGLVATVFSGAFPDCFIEGEGLTHFKIDSEYGISVLLIASLILFFWKRAYFGDRVFPLVVASIACTILSELCFTAYASVYGFANLVGHIAKLAAFYLIYRAIVRTGLKEPFKLIFRNLSRSEEELRESRDLLERRVIERTAALYASEARYRQLLRNLRAAVVVHAPDTRILVSNPMAEELLGLSEEQLLGKAAKDPAWRFLREDGSDMPFEEYPVNRTLAARAIQRDMVIGVRRPDRDEVVWAMANSEPTLDERGDIAEVVVTFVDITERQRAEQARLASLRFFTNLDQVNRAIQGAASLERMMADLLDASLEIFDCDRAFLLYPCDPEAASWRWPLERAKPEYPGVNALGLEVPMDEEVAGTFRIVLGSEAPVQFGPGTGHPLPAEVSERFSLKSLVSMAIFPKTGKPVLFGIHQCSRPRIWTSEEAKLLQEIGRRLADALTSLTYQSDLLESEAKYRRFLDTSNEGVWAVGPDLRTTFVNARLAEMLGYPTEEILGRSPTDFMPEEDALDHAKRMENRRRGLSEHYERRYLHRLGGTVWALLSDTPIFSDDNRFGGSFAMLSDITERKRAEEEIGKLNEDLERRVAKRTADLTGKSKELRNIQAALMNIVEDTNEKTSELERANLKLKELDQLKSMFIASMSHELRTPLNSIIGFSSILLDEWTGPLNAEQKGDLSAVLRSGKHLLSLINDVIDVSKIEAGMIMATVDEFDIADAAAEAVDALRPDIERKGLELKVQVPRRALRADRRRLLQCLLNLLSNAEKYTNEGTIAISSELSPDGSTLALAVEDTGIGIAEEDLGRLFSPFVRLEDALGSAIPGTGLGLYLTKKIVREILKGEISVASAFGTGSRFEIRLPVAR